MRAQGYSLWLMPAGELYQRLAATIRRLSLRCGTASFDPHVTLLGGLLGAEAEIIARCAGLSTHIRPYEIGLGAADAEDEYFRCLYLKVEPTAAVMEAYRQACEGFLSPQEPPYRPHLSLIYGTLPPETKEEIMKELSSESWPGFQVSSIHLFATAGEPGAWYRVREFPLHPN